MKIKFGALVVDGRGKIGGHVASKNRAGAYLRTKVTPVNPQTVAQSIVRNRLTAFAQGWRGLTQVQRDAWNSSVGDFSKTDIFGDIKQPSGLNLYVKLNANLDQVNTAAIDVPPLPSAVEPILSVTVSASVGSSEMPIGAVPSPVPAGTAYVVEATTGVSAGRNFLKNEFREIAIAATGDTFPDEFFPQWTAKFGTMIAGTKIGVRLTPVNTVTGQKGQSIIATTIAVA